MEANRKRSRGLLKGKLVPSFYREPKPSSSTVQYTATEVNQNHHSSSSSPASVGFVIHKDYAITKRNPKVRIVVQDLDDLYADPGDESVDIKAGIYISMVQQRLMLERFNTE
ncbi:hypothetical protein VNO77_16619 [Canavalia gladiata]|uniref:Uncharacterized protein n=1 Tax=Canavalia gladiata TaxID=3824 RepID=A0AAN9LHG0_CANGL